MSLRETTINTKELEKIRQDVFKFSQNPQKVNIVAVTKTFSFSAIKSAHKNKIYNIGENKIQELEKKTQKIKGLKNLKTHFIGRLQKNKIKKAVKLCDYIHSADSLKTIQRINQQAKKIEKKQKIYLQINAGEDEKKQGFLPKEIDSACQTALEHHNILIEGIMTILPQQITKEKTKKLYTKTKKIQTKIQKKYFKKCKRLSMGMSADYKEALECGATEIRIGTKLYGSRK